MFITAREFAAAHDGRFASAAALVCLVAFAASFAMLGRARLISGVTQKLWLGLIGIAGGTGIWALHFVGMVAYHPFNGGGFDPLGTLASLIVAGLTALAVFSIGGLWRSSWAPVAAALGFGIGVTAMHFVGMNAFAMAGHIQWNLPVILLSEAIALPVAGLAFFVARDRTIVSRDRQRTAPLMAGAALLTLSMCAMHFVGMDAAMIMPDNAMQMPMQAMSPGVLTMMILGVLILVLLTVAGAVLVNDYGTRRTLLRLRRLANGTFEGLAVVKDGRILDVNAALLDMTGGSVAGLSGMPIADLLVLDPADGKAEGRRDGRLRTADGNTLPVEVLARKLSDDETVYAVRDLRERLTAEARIRFLAEHDLLTGLLNRMAGRSRLDAALERGEDEPIAVLRIDIGGLREINETHGLSAGDVAIKAIAARVNLSVAKPSIVSRPGGSEFHVVQIGEDQPAGAARLANDLLARIREPIPFGRSMLEVTASIGVSLFPDDGLTSEPLLVNSDMALHRAKSGGGDGFRFFQREVDDAMVERRQLARDLKDAIGAGELRLYYQPLASTKDGVVLGFESLVRWQHPTHGLLSPDTFVPIAEENGLIGMLGEWVLMQACTDAAAWDRPLRVAVNLSPLHIHEAALPGRVESVLRATGLDPRRLELEITETALFRDTSDALDNLRSLKRLGARIAIDDFGTGYSSLSTLQSFPFDKIKIDKGFIESVNRTARATAIVRAIIGLGHSLGISVAAEGVERQSQLDFLKAERCEQVQGFIIGRPEPVEYYAYLTSTNAQAATTAA